MVQTSYSIDQAVAVEGLLGDLSPKQCRSYSATQVLPFGRLVSLSGTAGLEAKLPAASADVTATALGVTVFSHDQVNGQGGYPVDAVANVLRKGTIYVLVEEAVNAEDPVFVRFAAGAGGTNLGAFRKSADTATAVALPGAKYLTSAAADGLALIDLSI